VNQLGRFKVPQLLGQHLLGDIRHLPLQRTKPHWFGLQFPQDTDLPLAADDIQASLHRAGCRDLFHLMPYFPFSYFLVRTCFL